MRKSTFPEFRDYKHPEDKRRKERAELGRQEGLEGESPAQGPPRPTPNILPPWSTAGGLGDQRAEGMNPPPVLPAGQPPLPSF